ncbi:MAG: hypothetical protein D6705_03775 [Deltaproteobacteria bacterium]|nr:MAG: hypothetical protein D6705_03775 [Deltaproteobacteria bacterium]
MDLGKAASTAGITHVVWIPDSSLGRWAAALERTPGLRLLRVAREGEAWALALGLYATGARPLVVMQCTGLYESGDSLRNAVLDYGAPLVGLIGVRNATTGASDSAASLAEPFLRAFHLPYRWLEPGDDFSALTAMVDEANRLRRAEIFLYPEGPA